MIYKKEDLEKKILHISNYTYKNHEALNDVGVLTGQSGIAILQFAVARYFNDNSFLVKGENILENCIKKINHGYSFPTYCAGIAGLAWTLVYLNDKKLIELDNKIFYQFDEILIPHLRNDFKIGNYDFLHGALGYSFYFLKRFKTVKTAKLKNKYKNILNEVVSFFEFNAESNSGLMKWNSILDPEKGNIGYNLSMSHGISSIINFLSQVYRIDCFKDSTRELITGANHYVKSQMNNDLNSRSLFPDWVEPEIIPKFNGRVAWCYGDLGIALGLFRSGNSLEDNTISDFSLQIAKHTSKRRLKSDTLVQDASLCHGSLGVIQIFKEININHLFDETIDFWKIYSLEQILNVSALSKENFFPSANNNLAGINLLTGITGQGLGLLDIISHNSLGWEECLMISETR